MPSWSQEETLKILEYLRERAESVLHNARTHAPYPVRDTSHSYYRIVKDLKIILPGRSEEAIRKKMKNLLYEIAYGGNRSKAFAQEWEASQRVVQGLEEFGETHPIVLRQWIREAMVTHNPPPAGSNPNLEYEWTWMASWLKRHPEVYIGPIGRRIILD